MASTHGTFALISSKPGKFESGPLGPASNHEKPGNDPAYFHSKPDLFVLEDPWRMPFFPREYQEMELPGAPRDFLSVRM